MKKKCSPFPHQPYLALVRPIKSDRLDYNPNKAGWLWLKNDESWIGGVMNGRRDFMFCLTSFLV